MIASPSPLDLLDSTFPEGADLGTVRILAPGERAAPRTDPLSPLLVPLAESGERDLFALHDPPEAGARSQVVCAVDRETGVWAPLTSTVRGFAAWLLLLRRAQASLPGHAAFAARELLAETEPAATRLAGSIGLDLGKAVLEPDAPAIADRLREVDAASPWACSTLARYAEDPKAATRCLAPALLAAPFSSGLLEQAAELALAEGNQKKAVRALLAALSRFEPGQQAAPYRLDEPDEETGALFEPFRPAMAFRFLQENVASVDREARDCVAWQFLSKRLGAGRGCELEVGPELAIDASRRRGLGGDLPGGRWILHLALGLAQPAAGRAALLDELARQWELAGSFRVVARSRALAAALRATMDADPRVG